MSSAAAVGLLIGTQLSYHYHDDLYAAQVTSRSNTITETFGYDAYFRRTAHTHPETSSAKTTREFGVFEGPNVVATVTNVTGTLKDAYTFDSVDHPLRLSRGGAITYYELDLAGNASAISLASTRAICRATKPRSSTRTLRTQSTIIQAQVSRRSRTETRYTSSGATCCESAHWLLREPISCVLGQGTR